jgi:hypothetical protein
MTITTFGVPVDIPWRRIAFSEDMLDKTACDRTLPLRWRSSVAVFTYQPPDDQQQMDGLLISYLKVACTITGYQPDGAEINIRDRIERSGWTHKRVTDNIADSISPYYPCHGAVLEVVVAPRHEGVALADYPYFADFDPKKRELYELVTDTGEVMSRSLEDVNVRLGQTTLQSHEVRDTTSWSASLSAGVGGNEGAPGISGKGTVSNENQTTDLSQQQYENIRTTDSARESRETQSHTTQLSQMYHQLDSYHLGTNRALFFLLPRPHVLESPRTFVNGPREIEGIQEFMLVVIRPKHVDDLCVEAYLETAHLKRTPVIDQGSFTGTLILPKIDAPVEDRDGTFDSDDDSYTNPQSGSATYPVPFDSVIDTDRGDGGYTVDSVNKVGDAGFSFDVQPDHVTVNGWAIGKFVDNRTGNDLFPASIDLKATIFMKKKVGVVKGYTDGLLITGRGVCSCSGHDVFLPRLGSSLVHEAAVPNAKVHEGRDRPPIGILEANQLRTQIGREMVKSFGSNERYPRGVVQLLDSQLVAASTGAMINGADPDLNFRIANASGLDRTVRAKIVKKSPRITRSRVLQMPIAEQMRTFGLTIEETVGVRRALMDLDRREEKAPQTVRVPDVHGLLLEEGRRALAPVNIAFGGSETVDSPLPANVILEQDPKANATVPKGTPVTFKLASGLTVRLPDVVGLHLSDALCRIREAGLRSEPQIAGAAGEGALVGSLEPPPRTWVVPHAHVTVKLRRD